MTEIRYETLTLLVILLEQLYDCKKGNINTCFNCCGRIKKINNKSTIFIFNLFKSKNLTMKVY